MAKTKTKTKRKARKAKGYFPGMEPPSIPEIDELAQEYVTMRDNRMGYQKEELKLNDRLLELMNQHKLPTYKFDGLLVSVATSTKVKVKRDGEEAVDVE